MCHSSAISSLTSPSFEDEVKQNSVGESTPDSAWCMITAPSTVAVIRLRLRFNTPCHRDPIPVFDCDILQGKKWRRKMETAELGAGRAGSMVLMLKNWVSMFIVIRELCTSSLRQIGELCTFIFPPFLPLLPLSSSFS